jgi:hypothetical protein
MYNFNHRCVRRGIPALRVEEYGGSPPDESHADPPSQGAHFVQITAPREVLPGFFLFATQSDKAGTREMKEVSLLIRTRVGGAVIALPA